MGQAVTTPITDVILIGVVFVWLAFYVNREGTYQRLAREQRRKMEERDGEATHPDDVRRRG
jgi:hypothetical protein